MKSYRILNLGSRKGFTLIEVLACLMIMGIAFLGFYQGQAGSAKMALRAETRAQAYALAQKQMTELELQLRNKGFQGFTDEEEGSFKEPEFKSYRWQRKFEKVDVGCFLPEPNPDTPEAGFFQMASKIFEQTIRKMKITVAWEENKKVQRVSLTQLFVRWDDLPAVP